MADPGEIALTPDGSWSLLPDDGSVLLTDADGACPGYAMTPCVGGDATLSLRDEDNSDGAVTGDTVEYPVDSGVCYVLGCRACLTPTSEAATLVSGCEECGFLYALTPCCGGTAGLGLRPADKPMGAGVGSTIADPADGKCYQIGPLTDDPLAPTTAPWFNISTDCTDGDCPQCYTLIPCCCTSPHLALRPEDNPGVEIGDVVSHMGQCYTVAAASDSPLEHTTSEPVTVVPEGCDDESCSDECECGCANCEEDEDGVPGRLAGTYTVHFPSGTHNSACVDLGGGGSEYWVVTWPAFSVDVAYVGFNPLIPACVWTGVGVDVIGSSMVRHAFTGSGCTGTETIDDPVLVDPTVSLLWEGCQFRIEVTVSGAHTDGIPGGTLTVPAKNQVPQGTYTNGASI